MKALKEKRVSLRSLFRRSLVILSLLALAFAVASCNSDSGSPDPSGPSSPSSPSGPSDPSGPSEPTGPRDAPTVKSMVVLKHPNMPSYEGAAPDLSGLSVLVKLSDSKGTITEKTYTGASFTVDPPVANVKVAGEHLAWQQYTIYFRDAEDWFDTPSYGTKVWIPVVLALATDATVNGDAGVPKPDIKVDGKLGDVFEDLGINKDSAGSLKFIGKYVQFAFGADYGWDPSDGSVVDDGPMGDPATDWPLDYGYTSWDDLVGIKWTTSDNKGYSQQTGANPTEIATKKTNYLNQCKWPIETEDDDDDVATPETVVEDDFSATNPISIDPKAWLLNKRNDDKTSDKYQKVSTATYRASLGSPSDGVMVGKDQVVEITNFYRVDRLDYIDNGAIKNVKVITADDEKLGGNTVRWRYNAETNTYVPGFNTVKKATQDEWWNKLLNSGLEFRVIYYLPLENTVPEEKKTRVITMADYVKAMYLTDEEGTPRAALPIFSGAPNKVWKDAKVGSPAPGAGTIVGGEANELIDPSSPQHWAYTDGDYNLYLNLFYYSNLIAPYPTSKKGAGVLVDPNYKDYLNANPAQIPICTEDVHLVAQFLRFDSKRKDGSKHPTDEGQTGGEAVITSVEVKEDYNSLGSGAASATRIQHPRTRIDLIRQLTNYWTPLWIYEDPNTQEEIVSETSPRWYVWDTFENTAANPVVDNTWTPLALPTDWNKYQKRGLQDWDFDDIETIEIRECEVQFPAPPSLGPGEDDAIVLHYYVKP